MAKTVNLTVKVDDTEFRQFTARFNAFSAQIGNLNKQFSQINTTIQKTAASSNALTASMKALWQTTKSLSSTVASITTHFIKWSTLIGGVGAMLAMGGGLFGIERLAASIMQKRRMTLGLGGDYGRIQATQVFGRSLLESPGDVLKNIRMGQGGAPDQLRALLSLGMPFGSKMKPEEMLPKILEQLQQRLKAHPESSALRIGQAFGANALGLSDMDVMRLRNMSRQELKDLEEKIKAAGKEMTLSEKAQKGWSDLELQFKAAKTTIESIFGEKLASLSKPLSDLSDSIVKLVKTLLDMPIVEKMIKQLTTWLNQLSEYFKSNKLDKDLKAFSDTVEGWVPLLKEFKDSLITFVEVTKKTGDIMSKIWNFLKSVWKWSPAGLAYGAATGTGAFAPSAPAGPPVSPIAPASPSGQTGVPLMGLQHFSPTFLPKSSPLTISPGSTPAIPGPQGSIGGSSNFASLTGGSQMFGGPGGANSVLSRFVGGSSMGGGLNQFMGGSSSSALGIGGAGGILSQFSDRGGSAALGVANNSSNISSWSRAANGATPSAEGRSTWAGLFGFGGGGGGGGGGGRGAGALDSNNWQSNRTASLVIRNTPGSNINAAAAGMSG